MESRDKRKNKKRAPAAVECSEKAMFDIPPVSANEATGYAVTVPTDADEANALSDLMNIPVTPNNTSATK
jgi:hypothetical protein